MRLDKITIAAHIIVAYIITTGTFKSFGMMNPRGRGGPMRGMNCYTVEQLPNFSHFILGRGGMMMRPRGHGFHPYGGPPRGAMRGQRGAFMSYPGLTVARYWFQYLSLSYNT